MATLMAISNLVVVEDDEEEEVKSKNLVHYLGMKDGLTASIASQASRTMDDKRCPFFGNQTYLYVTGDAVRVASRLRSGGSVAESDRGRFRRQRTFQQATRT